MVFPPPWLVEWPGCDEQLFEKRKSPGFHGSKGAKIHLPAHFRSHQTPSKRLRNTLKRLRNGYEKAANGIEKIFSWPKNVHF
jgi:hypothetical protein